MGSFSGGVGLDHISGLGDQLHLERPRLDGVVTVLEHTKDRLFHDVDQLKRGGDRVLFGSVLAIPKLPTYAKTGAWKVRGTREILQELRECREMS